MAAVDFAAWVDRVRPELRPPVGNRLLYGDQLKVMVVGGPNSRDDFHIEVGEEIFYQLVGDMTLIVQEHGELIHIPIREGEVFCLPGRIPHSPQRLAGTVGLVIERERTPSELDGMRWFARDGSDRVLYEEWFHCTDLGTQLAPVIERFRSLECFRTGVPGPTAFPPAPYAIDSAASLVSPAPLLAWVAAAAQKQQAAAAAAAAASGGAPEGGSPSAPTELVLCGPGAAESSLARFGLRVAFHTGPDAAWGSLRVPEAGELLLYQLSAPPSAAASAATTVRLGPAAGGGEGGVVALPAGHMLVVPGGCTRAVAVDWAAGGVAMTVLCCGS